MVRFHLYTWWNLAYLNENGLALHLYGLERRTYTGLDQYLIQGKCFFEGKLCAGRKNG
ncbi:unnamed protein product [Musa acuminata subsp. malaccensis]|uniref:Uncharacterized protein n=1 Tax=Musa acuminata subsp. malaccensis TaxID=214687 RepID=A0A804U5Q8_MUSAM|nr:unnamed protein product [Musa acuminata subsp. malaccensis]